MMIGQRSWMCSGTTSRIRCTEPWNMPVLATPPACKWYGTYVSQARFDIDTHPVNKLSDFRIYLLDDRGHRKALVQQTQLTLGALFVGRVQKDAAVEDSTVDVADHRTNIPRAVRLGSVGRVLEKLNGLLDVGVPQLVVALVARVDGLVLGREGKRANVNELADRVIEGEAVDAVHEGYAQVDRRTVHAVASADHIGTRLEDVGRAGLTLRSLLEHREDGARGHVAVDVRRSVERVERHAQRPAGSLGHDDGLLLLLRNQESTRARLLKAINHDLVGEEIKLLDVITRRILGAGQTVEVSDARLAHGPHDKLERGLHGVEEDH
mmetsp:Transcript_70811/g.198368  ORF Transcript_70811/g.198368 Transcript_70811/m.198368 type:complete len:323 (-) Transcript_70811:170-1138(-)